MKSFFDSDGFKEFEEIFNCEISELEKIWEKKKVISKKKKEP